MSQPAAMPGMIAFANIGHAYTHLVLLLYPTVVLALESEFGLGYGELMALSVPGFLLVGAGALPAGWLADRWSGNAMMAIFFVGVGGACILTGLATSPLGIAFGLGLIGLFASIYHPVGIALLVRHAVNRGRALGVNGVFGGLGMAAAGFVAGGLTDTVGWRWAFFVPGAVSLATGLAFVALVRRPRLAARPTPLPQRVEAVLSRRQTVWGIAMLSVTVLGTGLIYQSTSVALPKVFAERAGGWLGSGVLDAGALFTVVYVVGAASQLLGGWLADRFPLKPVYVLVYALQVPLLLFAATLGGPALVAAAAVMVSLNMGSSPVENSLVARYAPADWRATAFGAKFVLTMGASGLAVPVVAVIHTATGGFYWFFITLAAFAAVVAAAALLLPGAGQPTREPHPAMLQGGAQ